MANNAANVIVGKPAVTGGALVADIGSTLPTDSTTALDAAFLAGKVGYVSEDGLVQSINSATTDIREWGGSVVRRVETEHDLTYKLTLIQTDDATLSVYYGDDNVDPGEVRIVAGDLPHKSWVFEINDGDVKLRIVVPDGQVTDRGDVSYTRDAAINSELTITAYPDEDGVKAYIYNDGVDES